jgi:AcrR family transcriptional regulator
MKTKERILLTARQMFNDLGYGNVTVAMLAEQLNMAKGNLWYHFNDKRSLLEALSLEFIEIDQKRRDIVPEENSVLEGYVQLLNTLAHEIRDFRFLFRDHSDYGEHSDSMLNHLPIIYDESLAQFRQFFIAMKKADHLNIEDNQIDPLALNSVIVLRYNLEFMRERQLLARAETGSVALTFEQHLTLFSDKLSAESLEFFRVSLLNSIPTEMAV